MAGTGSAEPGSGSGQARVLLVDDDANLRLLLRELLGRCGVWEVVGEACDGSQAVPLLQRLQPDVVLLD